MSIVFNGSSGNYLSRANNAWGNPAVGNYHTFMLWLYPLNLAAEWRNIYYHGEQDTCQLHYTKLNYWSNGTGTDGTADLAINTWYHIAITRAENTTVKLYINGGIDQTRTTSLIGDTVLNSYISTWGTTSDWMNARYTGLKIWQAELTQDEIRREMRYLRPVRYTNLWCWIPWFGGADRQRDWSGKSNTWTENGTITDAAGAPVQMGFFAPPLRYAVASAGDLSVSKSDSIVVADAPTVGVSAADLSISVDPSNSDYLTTGVKIG